MAAAAAAGGGGGDRPPNYDWMKFWVEGNGNKAAGDKAAAKNKVAASAVNCKSPLSPGVDEQELKVYNYQPKTGNSKVDKKRDGLVDDYNAIVRRRHDIIRRLSTAKVVKNQVGSRGDIRDVLTMAAQAKVKHDELCQSRLNPVPYPTHFSKAPKLNK